MDSTSPHLLPSTRNAWQVIDRHFQNDLRVPSKAEHSDNGRRLFGSLSAETLIGRADCPIGKVPSHVELRVPRQRTMDACTETVKMLSLACIALCYLTWTTRKLIRRMMCGDIVLGEIAV
jgi:hypothetical protein